MALENKTCTKCGKVKSVEHFGISVAISGKRRSACKKCCSSAQRLYAQANKDRLTAYDRQRRPLRIEKMREYNRNYQRRNSNRINESRRIKRRVDGDAERAYHRVVKREQYHKNPEKFRQRSRQYRSNNREARIAHLKEYRRLRPEQFATYQRKRIARKKGSAGQHSKADVERLLIEQSGRCHWCQSALHDYHVDHVIPLSRGGSNGPENIVISCPPCNLKKHARLPQDWIGASANGS